MEQLEYTEGPQALENFEKLAIAIFQKPKPGGRKMRKKSSKKASERKSENHEGVEGGIGLGGYSPAGSEGELWSSSLGLGISSRPRKSSRP